MDLEKSKKKYGLLKYEFDNLRLKILNTIRILSIFKNCEIWRVKKKGLKIMDFKK